MGRCDRLPGRYQPHYHQHVDGRNTANQLICSLSHYLHGFIHCRWLAGFLNHQKVCLVTFVKWRLLGLQTCQQMNRYTGQGRTKTMKVPPRIWRSEEVTGEAGSIVKYDAMALKKNTNLCYIYFTTTKPQISLNNNLGQQQPSVKRYNSYKLLAAMSIKKC